MGIEEGSRFFRNNHLEEKICVNMTEETTRLEIQLIENQ